MEEIWQVVLQERILRDWWKAIVHFGLSGGVGWLVYWWTLTTLSHLSSGGIFSHKFLKGESGIRRFSFLLALLFAIWVHVLQDYTLNWF